MTIERIVNGTWEENCYLVTVDTQTIIIDPGGNAEKVIGYIGSNGYTVLAILNTHGHFDHIGAVADLADVYKCPFYLHSKDERLLRSANLYMTLFAGEKPVRIPAIDQYIDRIPLPVQVNDFTIDVLFTPGHTEGSVCFGINDCVFTGDTLMKGSIGRTDLPGGNKQKLTDSLRSISMLAENLVIYPGHGEKSSIAEELRSNLSFIDLLKD
jgi:hydroxyacylglutathione hydrolase